IRAGVQTAAPNADLIAVGQKYDAVNREIVCYIEQIVEIDKEWPLLTGDAVHNFRSALDHLMWQLARIYLGRSPTEKQAKNIQFPEVRRVKDLTGNRFLTYVRPVDLGILKRYQPYKRLQKGRLHPLPKLIRLS